MAASAYYRIAAKDETKAGIRSALNGLQGLKTGASSALSGITKVAGGVGAALAAIGVAGLGIASIRDAAKAFQESESAAIKLAQAVRNNPLIDGTGFVNLRKYAEQLQRVTTYEDDELIAQESLLAGMMLSEGEIKAVMDAAVNLAASGLMPLETAVQGLGKTYSGTLGTIGRSIPALKGLTEAQLKNGEAVKIVAQNYAGMAEAMAKTEGGIYASFQNRMQSLQEAIGRPLSNIGVQLIDAITPGMEKLTKFLEENSFKVVNFFTKLPQIAMKALEMIPAVFEAVFSLDFIKAFFQGIWNYYTSFIPKLIRGIYDWFVGGFKAIGGFILAVSAGIWVPVREKFKDIIDGIKLFFANAINFLIERVNDFLAGLHKVTEFGPIKKALELLRIDLKPIQVKLIDVAGMKAEIAKRKDETPDMDTLIANEREKWYGVATAGLAQALGNFDEIFQGLQDTIGPAAKVIADKLAPLRKSIEDLINSTDRNTESTSPESIAAGGTDIPLPAPEAEPSWISKLLGKIGWGMESGKFTQLAGADLFAPFLEILKPVTAYLGQLAGPAAVLAVVFKGMMDILGPAIQTVLGPLINSLTFVGSLMGRIFLPILDALAPVISIIAQLFISFLEPILEQAIPGIQIMASLISIVLVPLLKLLSIGFEILSAPVRWVGDLFVWFGDVIKTIGNNISEAMSHILDPWNAQYSALPTFASDAFTGLAQRIADIWANSPTGSLAPGSWADWEALLQEGMETIPFDFSTASGAAGASYAAAGDIYLTINQNGVVVGDTGLDVFIDMIVSRLEERNYYGRT